MTALRALALFPVRPGPAAAALSGKPWALAAPLAPALVLAVFLAVRGAAPLDAAAAGGGLLLLVVGTGLGGVFGCYPATMLLGRPYDPVALAGPCFVFATWTAALFFALLVAGKAFGAGPAAALFAALTVLAWGVLAGIGLVAGDRETEQGRSLVASCAGLAVSLMGLWLGLAATQAALVTAVPAPLAADGIEPGNLLLVRVAKSRLPGDLVLLVRGREALIARVLDDGQLEAPGADPSRVGDWRTWTFSGRVFFRLGGEAWGAPLP